MTMGALKITMQMLAFVASIFLSQSIKPTLGNIAESSADDLRNGRTRASWPTMT